MNFNTVRVNDDGGVFILVVPDIAAKLAVKPTVANVFGPCPHPEYFIRVDHTAERAVLLAFFRTQHPA